MSNFSITINNETYGLISRYAVPSWLVNEYCSMPFSLNVGSEVLYFNSTEICFLCNRRFEEATRKCPLLCTNIEINHKLGRCGINCVDCHYFLRELDGYRSTPKSIKRTLDEGFYPVNIGKYLQL